MKKISKLLLGFLIAGSAQFVSVAADNKSGAIRIDDAWIRASAGGQSSGAGYMTVTNSSTVPDRLLSATSPSAGSVELHSTVNEGSTSKMVEIKDVVIPAKGTARFAPTGNHIMFLQIKGPFKEGEKIPVTLNFEKFGEARVDFLVKPTTFNPGNAAADHNHAGSK